MSTEQVEETVIETSDAPDSGAEENASTVDTPENENVERALSREAAKYRRQLREAESERDQLAEQVKLLRVRDVQLALNQEGLSEGQIKALWDIGLDPLSFLDDAGDVNSAKVAGVTQTLKDAWAPSDLMGRPKPALQPALTGGATPGVIPEAKTWANAIQQAPRL